MLERRDKQGGEDKVEEGVKLGAKELSRIAQ